jgi:glycerol-3-phosphate dehydrogenase
MNRDESLRQVTERHEPFDIVVIGGGATGLGIAVDAASRGYDVALFEQSDFAKGTSSRSTKLVHGGVRYLQQGNVALVMDALRERGILRRNAPHLVDDLSFIVPSYQWWESPFYGIGLKVYDLLAGRFGFQPSTHLSREEVVAEIPSIRTDGLRGGTRYSDGQFDDARLAVNLAQTAARQGAAVMNYAAVTGLTKDAQGAVDGVRVRDGEGGAELTVPARAVVNATGPFTDGVRRLDKPDAAPIIAPSQGVHVVLDKSFLPGDTAIMVPHTEDGRVMFAIPWHDVSVVGTTDTPIDAVDLEPRPLEEEIDFILETANAYLSHPAEREDIKSVFAGIRPLVKTAGADDTASLSRDHTLIIDPDSGLITIAGGKWTTYRKMAEDAVDQAADLAGIEPEPCVTKTLPIHGFHENAERFGRLDFYGADAPALTALAHDLPDGAERVHPDLELTRAEVVWACRHEMARTVDDVLARRSRSLLFDARAAIAAAPTVAALMGPELERDADWAAAQVDAFGAVARGYVASVAHRSRES